MISIKDTLSTRVGESLKRFRTQRGWSTRELAGHSGVSAAMISEVERAAKSPTITILSALATALEVPLSRLVDDTPMAPSALVVRASDHRAILDDGGAQRASLGPMLGDSRVEFVRLTLRSHGRSGRFAPHPAGSVERVHVVAGHVAAQLGTQTHELDVGDTLVFAGDVEHAFENVGGTEAVMFLVIDHGRGERATLPAHGS